MIWVAIRGQNGDIVSKRLQPDCSVHDQPLGASNAQVRVHKYHIAWFGLLCHARKAVSLCWCRGEVLCRGDACELEHVVRCSDSGYRLRLFPAGSSVRTTLHRYFHVNASIQLQTSLCEPSPLSTFSSFSQQMKQVKNACGSEIAITCRSEKRPVPPPVSALRPMGRYG